MKPRVYPETDDDPAFLTLLDQIIERLIESKHPNDVYIVRVKNWFDHKWLKFSGKGIIDFPQGYPFRDVALTEFHQEQVSLVERLKLLLKKGSSLTVAEFKNIVTQIQKEFAVTTYSSVNGESVC